jgi:hypothetical protein
VYTQHFHSKIVKRLGIDFDVGGIPLVYLHHG